MIILGIETSCDETSLAIYDEKQGLLANKVHTQLEQLTKYGGVIPEVAARYHIQYLTPLLNSLLEQCSIKLNKIDLIAYTKGPGLVGSLLTGIAFAKSLSFGLKIPAIGINHLEGHILACFIKESGQTNNFDPPQWPFIALLASGGHTMIVKVNQLSDYEIIGETLDDAAGEALDKTAKLLGLTPPSGKTLAELAINSSTPNRFYFPRPLLHSETLNFSFSGLKTAALNKINNLTPTALIEHKADLAYAFQEAVMDLLVHKCKVALEKYQLNQLVISGGVSANLVLREKLHQLPKTKLFLPKLEFCTDNAAMIAVAGLMRAKLGQQDLNLNIEALARWDLY